MSFTSGLRALALLVLLAVARVCAAEAEGETLEMGYTWTVKARYPKLEAEAAERALGGWLEKHIEKSVAESAGLAVADPDLPEGTWEMDVGYETTKPSEHILSVMFTTYTYPSRAAHPMTTMNSFNVDLATGRILEFADLFGDPEKALAIMSEKAPALVNEYLMREYTKDLPNGIEDDAWFKDGFAPETKNFSCLGLEPDGVRVYFQKYQVLPYVFGTPSAFMPLSMLEPALPNPEVWTTK